MKLNTIEFIGKISNLRLDPACQTRILSVATALAVSRWLHLPAGPVDSQVSHYMQQCAVPGRQMVSQLNEVLMTEGEYTYGLLGKFWKQRYAAAYGAPGFVDFPGRSQGTFFDALYDTLNIFSDEEMVFMEKHRAGIIASAGLIFAAVRQLGEEK